MEKLFEATTSGAMVHNPPSSLPGRGLGYASRQSPGSKTIPIQVSGSVRYRTKEINIFVRKTN